MITIAPNSWPGFQGLYHSPRGVFVYIINNRVYNDALERDHDEEINDIVENWNLVPIFEVDPQGSDVLVIESRYNGKYMLYQKRSNGLFVELIPRTNSDLFARSEISSIMIPLPNGEETSDEIFSIVEMEDIENAIFIRLENVSGTYDQILNLLNEPRMITIAPNAWPGFQGLYHSPEGEFNYIINNRVYNTNLERYNDEEINDVVTNWSLVPPFQVDPEGSDILVIESDDRYMLYQQRDERFVELLPRQPGTFIPNSVYILIIPSNDGIEVDDQYSAIQLDEISDSILNRVSQQLDELSHEPLTYNQLLNILNPPVRRSLNTVFDQLAENTPQRRIYQPSMIARQATGIYNPDLIPSQRPLTDMYNEILNRQRNSYQEVQATGPYEIDYSTEDTLFKESYETLLKRLYNLGDNAAEFLMINGLKVNFIPFSQVSSIQIIKYEIDPLLQPWSDVLKVSNGYIQNRILRLFDTNGMTYLVKARYDPVSHQIFPPV